MEHGKIRAQLAAQIQDLLAKPDELAVTLRPYQLETLASAATWLADPGGTHRAYVNYATGLGKTVLFAAISAAAVGQRILVIVPTKALLEQTARVIARFTGGILGHLSSLAHIQDNAGETIAVRGLEHSTIVLTTDASFNMLASQIKIRFDPHLIIRDECHWGYVESALEGLNQFPEAVIIGFSATPDFLTNTAKEGYVPVELDNGRTLYGPRNRFAMTHFQTCLDRRTIRWGIENGWLSPIAWGMIELDTSLKDVRTVEGPHGLDYEEGDLQKLMSKHWSVMCEAIRRLYEDPEEELAQRQAYAICPSVEAAEELAKAVSSLGIPAACVTGSTPDMERNILLQAYRDNQIRLLSSVMILREGWDAPNAEVCMMLRPTKSRVLYEQAIGRVVRLREDGEHKVALVLDAHFQNNSFTPLSAPIMFGKPGDEVLARGVLVGSRGGYGKSPPEDSPYLSKSVKPRVVIIEEEFSIEQPANLNRLKRAYWPLSLIAKRLGVEEEALKKRLEDSLFRQLLQRFGFKGIKKITEMKEATLYRLVKNIRGTSPCQMKPDASGQMVECWRIEEVAQRCEDLLKDLPRVGEEIPKLEKGGTFEVNGEIFAPVHTLRKLLGLRNDGSVKTRILQAGLRYREGRIASSNQRIKCYALSKAKVACANLKNDKP